MQDKRSKIKELLETWNRGDLESFIACYAEDAMAYDPMYTRPLRGRDAIRKDFDEFKTAFPDMTFTPGAILESGETVAFEVTCKGTHKGPLRTPEGQIDPTNKSVEMSAAIFVKMNDGGLIAEERRYFDCASLVQQLGREAGRKSA